MHPLIESHRQQIAALCQRHGVVRLDVFGSALRDDFDASRSDFDAVVEFGTGAAHSGLSQYFGLKSELGELLQRPIDLVELKALPDSRLKRIIERSKLPFYAASA
ncbi:MAG: nucleotidyltransferase domain-containing protein [Pseudomonadota bacterium]